VATHSVYASYLANQSANILAETIAIQTLSVYDLPENPKIYVLNGPPEPKLALRPRVYSASRVLMMAGTLFSMRPVLLQK